jgi:hypothetical protein
LKLTGINSYVNELTSLFLVSSFWGAVQESNTLFLPITLSRKFDQSKWEQVQLI